MTVNSDANSKSSTNVLIEITKPEAMNTRFLSSVYYLAVPIDTSAQSNVLEVSVTNVQYTSTCKIYFTLDGK